MLNQGSASTSWQGGVAAGEVTQTIKTPTLIGAMSSLDDLNKRLFGLRNAANEIAQMVGGPYPVGESAKRDVPPQSAMHRLNEGVTDAHGVVGELENALSAMRRALGS